MRLARFSLLKRTDRTALRLAGDPAKGAGPARRLEIIRSICRGLLLGRGGCLRRQEFIDSRREARDFAGGARFGNHPFGRGAVERRGRFLESRFCLILILFGKGVLNPLDGGSNGGKDTPVSLSPFFRLPVSLQCRWMICHD